MYNRRHMKTETRGRHITMITRRARLERAEKILKAELEAETPEEIESEQGLPAILNEETEPLPPVDEELEEAMADPDPEKEMTDVLLSAVEDRIAEQPLPVTEELPEQNTAPRELIYDPGDAKPRAIDPTGTPQGNVHAFTPEDPAGSPPMSSDPADPVSESPADSGEENTGEEGGEE